MTAGPTSATTTDAAPAKDPWQDPELYRMSVGEHLEDLRRRMIRALLGLIIALVGCLYFGNTVVAYFCRPLLIELHNRNLPVWTVDHELGGTFMVFIQISLISAAAISAPWIVYQLWLFVAAGLYPQERKWVMRYAPLSIVLLVGGMLFVYFLVLPWTIQFFLDWTISMPIPTIVESAIVHPTTLPDTIQILDGNPPLDRLADGSIWFNQIEGRLNIVIGRQIRSLPFAPQSLVVPQYSLKEYINLVVMMLLMFGLAFQLPLVVAAIIKIGIIEPEQFKAARRYVYFALLIIAAAITPGDVITATIALLGPLILLYEFGIILGQIGSRRVVER